MHSLAEGAFDSGAHRCPKHSEKGEELMLGSSSSDDYVLRWCRVTWSKAKLSCVPYALESHFQQLVHGHGPEPGHRDLILAVVRLLPKHIKLLIPGAHRASTTPC
jgi:hypothetical protein